MIYGYIKPNMVTESFNKIEDSFLNESNNLSDLGKTVKKHESELKRFINKYANEFYKDSMSKNNDPDDDYNWCNDMPSVPKFDEIDYDSTDIPCIILKYPSSTDHDSVLFFESEFVKFINKQKDKLSTMFTFRCEDYPGIYVRLKK